MSIAPTMIEVKASGTDIANIADRMANAINDVEPAQVYIACLFMAAIIMNPQISGEQLQLVIKETSRYMHLLDEPEGGIATDMKKDLN
jgi:hypothetical protein